jgi:DNA-binding SARP family transcriptional activator
MTGDHIRGLAEGPQLFLLGGFELRRGRTVVELPTDAQRVCAFLALHSRPPTRTSVSGVLWTSATEDRANANLRAALWKIRRRDDALVAAKGHCLSLQPAVRVDVTPMIARARRLLECGDLPSDDVADRDAFSSDLLPDWDEDWVVTERERLRQLRLHALEELCRQLSRRRRHGEAIDAGLAAVASEPLRESAQLALIKAYLAEGNVNEARRQGEEYRTLLWEDLRLEPSPAFQGVLAWAGLSSARPKFAS